MSKGKGGSLPKCPLRNGPAGGSPGRIRLRTFRPGHGEPITDVLIGQGMMWLGGGGYGGKGLPRSVEVLQLGGRGPHG